MKLVRDFRGVSLLPPPTQHFTTLHQGKSHRCSSHQSTAHTSSSTSYTHPASPTEVGEKFKSFGNMVRPAATRVASFAAAAASLSLMILPPAADAHPLCFYGPDRAVSFDAEATFCPNEDPEGFCCNAGEEAKLQTKFESETLSADCAPLYKEVGLRMIVVSWWQNRCRCVGDVG